jgi:hypothetical protein
MESEDVIGCCDLEFGFIQENIWLMYAQYGGSPVKVGDEEYHLFRDHE